MANRVDPTVQEHEPPHPQPRLNRSLAKPKRQQLSLRDDAMLSLGQRRQPPLPHHQRTCLSFSTHMHCEAQTRLRFAPSDGRAGWGWRRGLRC